MIKTANAWRINRLMDDGLKIRLNPLWASERSFNAPRYVGQVVLSVNVPYGMMEVG